MTDVIVIAGKNPDLQPPIGYTKIPVDLRQTPSDLERVPNLDYVFLCYRSDKPVTLYERDLLIFRKLAYLEKSISKRGTEEYKGLSESKKYLQVNFNFELMLEVAKTLKEATLGPVGANYVDNRQDVLFDIAYLIYNTYIHPIIVKIDLYNELRGQNEFSKEFKEATDELVLKVKAYFVESL